MINQVKNQIVRLDLNNPVFQRQIFKLLKNDQRNILIYWNKKSRSMEASMTRLFQKEWKLQFKIYCHSPGGAKFNEIHVFRQKIYIIIYFKVHMGYYWQPGRIPVRSP